MTTISSFVLTVLACSQVWAAVLTTPPGLNPGDQYRIAFVTSTTRDATSIVNNTANAAGSLLQPLGATWVAIGSTATVAAFDNIGGVSDLPIYLLDGSFLASGTADLWDGSIAEPLDLDELGNTINSAVWTGTRVSGTNVGAQYLGNSFVHGGSTIDTDGRWILEGNGADTLLEPLYGISGALTVAPEPSTLGIVMAGAIFSLLHRRLNQR